MKKWQVVIAVVALLGCGFLPGTARAANRPQAFSLTPFAGGYVFEGSQPVKDRPVYGLALGYNFGEHWGAEGVFSYIDTSVTSGPGEDVDVYALRLDVLYHFRPDKSLVPYLAAGLGAMEFDGINGGDDEDMLVDYGLGLKYFVSENVALRVDVRHVIDINMNDSDREHDAFQNLSYTAGLTFQFGG